MNKPAAALGWGFAIVAALTSAAYAYTIPDDPYTPWALVAISIGAVVYERYAVRLARKNRAAKDHTAFGWGYLLLVAACLYTASMQLGFFGDLILKPMAADSSHELSVQAAEKKAIELEQRRGWLDKPNGTTDSLAKLVMSLEKSKRSRDLDALRQARKDLAAAEALDMIDTELTAARAHVAALRAQPPKDGKGAVIEGITFGHVKAEWVSYLLVVLSVAFLQACQILLPIVSGEGRDDKGGSPAPDGAFLGDRQPAAARLADAATPPTRQKRAAPQITLPSQQPQPAALPPPRKGSLAARIKAAS